MTQKEFIYWLKGIIDTTNYAPSPATWDLISDTLKEVLRDDPNNVYLDRSVLNKMGLGKYTGNTTIDMFTYKRKKDE